VKDLILHALLKERGEREPDVGRKRFINKNRATQAYILKINDYRCAHDNSISSPVCLADPVACSIQTTSMPLRTRPSLGRERDRSRLDFGESRQLLTESLFLFESSLRLLKRHHGYALSSARRNHHAGPFLLARLFVFNRLTCGAELEISQLEIRPSPTGM
jgi:hypothetical protein